MLHLHGLCLTTASHLFRPTTEANAYQTEGEIVVKEVNLCKRQTMVCIALANLQSSLTSFADHKDLVENTDCGCFRHHLYVSSYLVLLQVAQHTSLCNTPADSTKSVDIAVCPAVVLCCQTSAC